MTEFEYLVAQVMTEHDDEAPGAADLLRALAAARASAAVQAAGPRRSRRGWLVPAGAALAVATVMVGSAWAGGLLGGKAAKNGTSTAGRPAALSCPARYRGPAPWVPAGPAGTGSAGGQSRLAPLRTPATAVICAYLPDLSGKHLAGHLKGHVLTSRRQLTSGLAALDGALAWLPRLLPGQQVPCLTVLGPQRNYLIGLTFAGGRREWISTTADPSGCVLTSNGAFTTFGNASAEAAQAISTGRWPAPGPVRCGTGGRLGQETAMVPAGATSLTICQGGRAVRTLRSGFQSLAAALNALPTRTSTWGCSSVPRLRGSHYWLEFGYPRGPAVQVSISTDCDPAIDNLSLQARSAAAIVPVIERLLRRP